MLTPVDERVRDDVHEALIRLEPTVPITLEDASAVYQLLHPIVSPPYSLDVYYRGSAIHVTVQRAGEVIARRELSPRATRG